METQTKTLKQERQYFSGDNISLVDPSDAVGDPVLQLAETMNRLVPLFKLSGNLFTQLAPKVLEQRLNDMRNQPQQIIDSNNSVYNFISDSTNIQPLREGRPYKLDDDDVYKDVLPTMRRLYKSFVARGVSEEVALFSSAIHTAQIEQTRYFDALPVKSRKEAHKQALARVAIADLGTEDTQTISISRLKSVAMCSQRAAVAHNILQVIGIPSVFESGYVGKPAKDGSNTLVSQGGHAFLRVTNARGEEKIFDPSHPKQVKENGETIREIAVLHDITGKRGVTLAERPVKNITSQTDTSDPIVYGFKN